MRTICFHRRSAAFPRRGRRRLLALALCLAAGTAAAAEIAAARAGAPAVAASDQATTTGPARSADPTASHTGDIERLVAALLGNTPLVDDFRDLADRIGGRPTGSPANLRAVEWGLERFNAAGVEAHREPFTMPVRWLERRAAATIAGDGVRFAPRVAAMPYSAGTGTNGASGPLVDGGAGAPEDFTRLGASAEGAFLLVETRELTNIDDLFKEYVDAAAIEQRAFASGAAGVVYMGSRPNNLLYRHNVSTGAANTRPMLVMERDAAHRALRLLRRGTALTIREEIEIDSGPAYESYNVVAEIRGRTRPDEVVVFGAHLDSWDLGTGALDNGANVAMMIDLARQIQTLGIRPARTIRLGLWNGEEQGLYGSFGYVTAHRDELDRHVLAGSVDIGCGRITGFFTGARPEVARAVEARLAPVAGLGPFAQVDAPIVGTDNYDFMIEGVANVVANQEPALYGPNYHARSDEFDKCDTHQLRLNAAIVGALVLGFADDQITFTRQSRADIEGMMRTTDLPQQMKIFGDLWQAWEAGRRGRQK